MSEAFVYLWYDSENRMFYLGKHKGTPEDRYTHSSSIWESFTKDNIPKGTKRRILTFGTHEEMCELEHNMLKNRKSRCWDRYYNESLGDPRYVDTSGENHHNWQGRSKSKKIIFNRVYKEVSRFREYYDMPLWDEDYVRELEHLRCIKETKRLIVDGYEGRPKLVLYSLI